MIDSALKQRVAAELHRYWWLFLIRGLLGLALGVFALVYPGATLAAIVILIGAYLIFDGIIAIVKAIQILRSDSQWWILLLEGILGIVVGVAILAWPGLSVLTLAFLVGFWAIFSGILAVAAALRFRAYVTDEWLYTLFGIVSVVFGGVVLFKPATGLVYIVLMTSIYGFVMGFTMLALAFRARSLTP